MSVPQISHKDPRFEEKFCGALRIVGFVQIVDHDVLKPSKELLDFFQLSMEEKCSQKYGKWFPSLSHAPKEGIEWKGDGREFFKNMNFVVDGESCRIDEENSTWFTLMKFYRESNEKFATELLEILEKKVGFDTQFSRQKSSTLRIIRYDKETGSKQRCEEHTDSGLLTLLWQDSEGLEVLVDGSWVRVPVVQGGLIINIGDILSIASDGKLKATLHRVVSNQSSNHRHSIPYFVEPRDDYLVPNTNLKYTDWLDGKLVQANFIEYLDDKMPN